MSRNKPLKLEMLEVCLERRYPRPAMLQYFASKNQAITADYLTVLIKERNSKEGMEVWFNEQISLETMRQHKLSITDLNSFLEVVAREIHAYDSTSPYVEFKEKLEGGKEKISLKLNKEHNFSAIDRLIARYCEITKLRDEIASSNSFVKRTMRKLTKAEEIIEANELGKR